MVNALVSAVHLAGMEAEMGTFPVIVCLRQKKRRWRVGKLSENCRKIVGELSESRRIVGELGELENCRRTVGELLENCRRTVGESENCRKTVGESEDCQ